MWSRAVYLLLVLSLSYPLGASAPIGAVDSVGREFVLAFQSNHDGESPYLGLFIASHGGATGTVGIPGLDFRQSISIAANELIRVELPRVARDLPDNRVSERAVQLSLDGDATVYAINRTRHTTDAFLALPVDALGTRYRIMAYRAVVGSSQVAVAATADGTEVRIWPSAPVSGASADEPLLVRLDRGQVYSLVGANPSADLTGTSIESSAPVAVMAGAECANVPPESTACDHLVQMMPPLSTWGKRFVTLPIATRKKGDLIRILADSDGTRVRIDGTDVAELDAGESLDKILVDGVLIEADRPILVGQFSLGTSYDKVVSDPFFTLVPPSEQFLDRYIFATPESGFRSHYVGIIAPTDSISSLSLDGHPVDGTRLRPIGGSELSGGALELSQGIHRISGDEPFGILVYGFDTHDSYGYPGGMAFTRINPIGDRFKPAVAEVSTLDGRMSLLATDSEDSDANGLLDSAEDLDGDGRIGRRNEDLNGNRRLDTGEDGNEDGIIDRDAGLARVELVDGAENLRLESAAVSAGALAHEFSVALIDPSHEGVGEITVIDVAGNRTSLPVRLPARFRARFGEQPDLRLGRVPDKDEVTGDLIPRFEQRDGNPLVCLLPYLIGLLVALIVAIIVYGFIWPARFRPQMGIILSNEEDLEEGFFLLLRAQRGTGIRFYRHARAYVRKDYRVCGQAGGAIARLRADRGRILIRPMPGNELLRQSEDGRWETLDERETGARAGTLYRNGAGTLYFMLRSR